MLFRTIPFWVTECCIGLPHIALNLNALNFCALHSSKYWRIHHTKLIVWSVSESLKVLQDALTLMRCTAASALGIFRCKVRSFFVAEMQFPHGMLHCYIESEKALQNLSTDSTELSTELSYRGFNVFGCPFLHLSETDVAALYFAGELQFGDKESLIHSNKLLATAACRWCSWPSVTCNLPRMDILFTTSHELWTLSLAALSPQCVKLRSGIATPAVQKKPVHQR